MTPEQRKQASRLFDRYPAFYNMQFSDLRSLNGVRLTVETWLDELNKIIAELEHVEH